MTPKNTTPDSGFTCLDFRRAVLLDPRQLPATAREHLEQCPLCEAFLRRAEGTEQHLSAALAAVAIPEGLNERILLRALRPPRSRWMPYALAASLLVAVALSWAAWQMRTDPGQTDLALAAVHHVRQEGLEQLTHHSEAPDRIGAVMASFGGELTAPLGKIDYIHYCPIEGFGMGWHITFDTDHGKITLLLVPLEAKRAKTETVRVEGHSVQLQRAGNGYYALIADSPEALDEASARIRKAVRWES